MKRTKKTYTKEEKNQYFADLRAQWRQAKEYSKTHGEEIKAIILNHGLNISPISYILVKKQMDAQNLDGFPYLDMKTFYEWKQNGFKVMKNQHATAHGITWISVDAKKTTNDKGEEERDGNDYKFPKSYGLFHRSQVEPITVV